MKLEQFKQIIREEINKVLNEANTPTWYPKKISVLKDIYVGEDMSWTSVGTNSDDFVVSKGEVINLYKDGSSSKSKPAFYEVNVLQSNKNRRSPKSNSKDIMEFPLKEIAQLLKQKAIKILDKDMYGHDITLNALIKK
jgi:hypothetical protein